MQQSRLRLPRLFDDAEKRCLDTVGVPIGQPPVCELHSQLSECRLPTSYRTRVPVSYYPFDDSLSRLNAYRPGFDVLT
ncbi:hypothetical protein Acsp01_89680 [Actinoplanes sp. NBRC 101535]|nr:hypothetical protein Acsp01_89680 [Actinoplanes sp. NBRC 101535]